MSIKLLLLSLFTLAIIDALATIPTARRIISIEKPHSIEDLGCEISDAMTLSYHPSLVNLKKYILSYIPLKESRGSFSEEPALILTIDSLLGSEGYQLKVSSGRIEIIGGDYGGVFNGIQTFFQCLPPKVYTKNISLPLKIDSCFTIEDSPAFSYRGVMIDVARTWIGVEEIKREIDLLSYHKLNKLHLHLTDDEGWRIEIKSHPDLTSIGAYRGGDSPIAPVYGKWDQKYGGYYTQEQMADIIEYAAQRNIEIIPEIDLPGHSRNIARVRPEILCNYTSNTYASNGYDERSAWCVAKQSNYDLLEDILSEICTIFPTKNIHIGGDEVIMSQWRRCPDCMALIRERQMTDTHQLEDLFISRVSNILKQHDKNTSVWDEAIIGGGLSKETIVYGWQSVKSCLTSINKGYSTVVMPGAYFYIDMKQGKHEPGHNWAGMFDTEKSYSFNFKKEGFTTHNMNFVKGMQMAFWSEAYISNSPEKYDYLDYMSFPRLCALSELSWHGKSYDWSYLNRKLIDNHYDRMVAMGIKFRLSPPKLRYNGGFLELTVDDRSQIYYTIDGRTEPTIESKKYNIAIKTDKPHLYQFRSFYSGANSPIVAHSSFYKIVTPPVELTTTMGESKRTPYSNVNGYKTFARTTRAPRLKDEILYTFTTPLACREIYLQTGDSALPKAIVTTGDVEISSNGVDFTKVGELDMGSIRLYDLKNVKAIRIASTCNGNGCAFVTIQYPRIKSVK